MTSFKILHVDDEPDIREVVMLSLGLDPMFSVESCASGEEAIAKAAVWLPDMILCDVMMPVMDGPATLARLRQSPGTAKIPVIFMTARAETRELEHLMSIGAEGVIAKPFNPMTLAESVRSHLRSAGLAALRSSFVKRMQADTAALIECRANLKTETNAPPLLEKIKSLAHALTGTAGIFGIQDVCCAASTLEKTAINQLAGDHTPGKVEGSLDALLTSINRA
jgi:CheY-like chemotaxis protein